MADPSSMNANVEQWDGFADDYDRYRPQPPAELVNLLCQLARAERPWLVVDLGCGTGLATRLWAEHATHVIGIEPNQAMRHIAEAQTRASGITYQSGYGHETGLADECADIVTAANSLQWMEPLSTVAEITRILRPAGVFAQIDFKWPMTVDWELELAIHEAKRRCDELEQKLSLPPLQRFNTSQHFELIQSSGAFRYTNELALHRVQSGSPEQVVGLLTTDSGFQRVLKHGVSEDELGLTVLRQVADRVMGTQLKGWYFSYRVRLAVK
jgi:ubiquinone/menaquinone biosynthesis C-methylase UbiE